MPYIKQETRPLMDKVVEVLHEGFMYNDELIYILFEYCKRNIKPSYNNYKNFCGELCQCATEIERRAGAEELSIVNKDIIEPNVSKGRLSQCNRKIEFMKEADIQVNGDLNYILYAYCIRHVRTIDYHPNDNFHTSFFARNLRLAAKKITKEILAPYEDSKIVENGDVE